MIQRLLVHPLDKPRPAVFRGTKAVFLGTKSKQKEPDLPKSTEVRRLEGLKDGLRGINHGVSKDPKGGCFCQGVSCCVVM